MNDADDQNQQAQPPGQGPIPGEPAPATPAGEPAPATPGGEPAPATPGDKAASAARRRRPLISAAGLLAALALIAGLGYFGGIGPLNSLSAKRDLNPPDKLGGLTRITDTETRDQLQLDAARDALSRSNKGNKTSVEAYGDVASTEGLYVVIALRGKIDIDKTLQDSGATGDQIKKVGDSSCATTSSDSVATCYRSSNTLTVMVRDGTGKAGVDKVGPLTDEAYDKLK